MPNIKETTIYSNKVSSDFKLVQLTDLHIGQISKYEWLKSVIKLVNKQNADIILITGDIADGSPKLHTETIKLFSDFKSKYGVYAVTGNHEYYYNYDGWLELYNKNNVKFLFNENVKYDDIVISGVPDLVSKRYNKISPDFSKAIKGVHNNEFIIHLDHRPGSFTHNSRYIDLQLSGHTHGGMLPILEKIIAKYNNGYVAGEYKLNKSILNLSNGSGIWAGFPLRMFDDAEINVITIKPSIEK